MGERINRYGAAGILVSCLGMVLAGTAVTLGVNAAGERRERAARVESERAICEVVEALDTGYREAPPTTPTGKRIAEKVAELRTARCS